MGLCQEYRLPLGCQSCQTLKECSLLAKFRNASARDQVAVDNEYDIIWVIKKQIVSEQRQLEWERSRDKSMVVEEYRG